MQGRKLFRTAAASAALLTGVIASRAALPALNNPSSQTTSPGKFEWADLFTGDLDSAEQFYTGLFAWTASDATDPKSYKNPKDGHKREYVVLSANGVPLAGLVQREGPVSKSEHPARWVGYLGVSDLAASLKAVKAAGGKVASPEHRVPDRGRQAIVIDPEESVVGLLQSSSGDLADHESQAGQWLWFELYSKTPKMAGTFYQQAFNYQVSPDAQAGKPGHFLLAMGGQNRAGISPLPAPEASPDWIGFIRVDDLDAKVAKVTSLGGAVIVAPEAAEMDSRFALVSDPTGGVFGLVQFENSTHP